MSEWIDVLRYVGNFLAVGLAIIVIVRHFMEEQDG